MTKVLVADKFEKVGLDGMEELGCKITLKPDVKAEDLPALLREIDPAVLIVRSKKVNADALKAATNLSLVIRAGAGVDTIDVGAASSLGIFVANCPGKNSIAVAELAIGLLLSMDRRIPDQVADLRAGKWNKGDYSKARGLHGRVLGIVGLGEIGKEVAHRAKALGMSVIAWSRKFTKDDSARLGIGYAQTPLDVARGSDAVTIHVAGTAETKHLVNAQFLDALRPGAYLINTSRGSVVDEEALAKAVKERGIRVGLDVFANEPAGGTGEFAPAILKEAGTYGTHHVGASTDQAQVAIAHEVIRIVQHFIETQDVLNCVNRLARSSATSLLSVRHQNKPGVLAHVFKVLAERSINVEEVENIIYRGAEANVARLHLDSAPDAAALKLIKEGNANVISVALSPIEKKG